MEAESKMDWQRKASAGTSKITTFLGPAESANCPRHSADSDGAPDADGEAMRTEIVAGKRVRGLVNHRPKSSADITRADEYRVQIAKSTEASVKKMMKMTQLFFATT